MAATKRRRGRPAFKPTRATRVTVERMLACGDSQNTIARALGIDDDTLRKHFPEEILNGAAKRRREIVDLLFDGARAKNASLIKRVEEMTRGAAAQGDALQGGEASRSAADKRGKKEVRRDEALVAGEGSEWGEDLKPLPGTLPN